LTAVERSSDCLVSNANGAYFRHMLKIATTLALIAVATPASALCISFPDGGTSNYVENGTAHMLCLQRELGQDTALAAERARIESELGNIRIELERQQQLILQQQAQLSAWH
jgi:hypothetical protein